MDNTLTIFLYLLGLNPNNDTNFKGYSKHRAIIVGHMVRMSKLYEGFLMHTEKHQYELAGIFIRLIYETDVRIDYFFDSNHKRKTFRNFILISYRAIKAQLKEFINLSQSRSLTAQEKRMRKNMMKLLKSDGITRVELLNNTNWELDRKDFASLLRHLNREDEYASIFGHSSTFVHGNWHDINSFHLTKDGKYYLPKLQYTNVDLRIATFITYICLNRLLAYVKWNQLIIEEKCQAI